MINRYQPVRTAQRQGLFPGCFILSNGRDLLVSVAATPCGWLEALLSLECAGKRVFPVFFPAFGLLGWHEDEEEEFEYFEDGEDEFEEDEFEEEDDLDEDEFEDDEEDEFEDDDDDDFEDDDEHDDEEEDDFEEEDDLDDDFLE